jgi:hypothetical protein
METNEQEIDVVRLAAMTLAKRNGRSYREIGREAGVAPATILRVEKELPIDLNRFVKMCRWLGYPGDHFFNKTAQTIVPQGHAAGSLVFAAPIPAQTPTEIEGRLRMDKYLPAEQVDTISKMIKLAYEQAAKVKGEALDFSNNLPLTEPLSLNQPEKSAN